MLKYFLPVLLLLPLALQAAPLDHAKLLEAQTFWDNRDFDWYKANIPFLDTPDAELNTTYYYRWELLTKHLTYGSANSGYSFTEFIDRPFWSGAYGEISCPAGHQLYEARWLRSSQITQDYSRYWFNTPGAQPRRYSTWLADAIVAANTVHPDDAFLISLLSGMVKNFEGWEKEHFDPKVGLFWQNGHDDGMEFNINSRQSQDILRGAPGYRPTLNAYLYADALAIARAADLAGDANLAKTYRDKAASLKEKFDKLSWDDKRQFYLHVYQRDENRDGHIVKALSRIYQTGQFAGNEHGREEIGFVPWQFNFAPPGREIAWKFLMHRDYFWSDFGPTTVERKDPMFLLQKSCCWWSGQSWPYATAQTLKALANLLQSTQTDVIGREDYYKLLHTFAITHRKAGKPYIAEAAHPDTGSFEGHDGYNHSEHYFHSSFNDLVITGLVGLRPRPDDTLEIHPLAPESWDYFALDNLRYRNHDLAILWDKTGTRYNQGKGLTILCDGQKLASAEKLQPLFTKLPPAEAIQRPAGTLVNFAVNNDGNYYPRISATFTAPKTSPVKLIDGNYWYHLNPPNRWTAEASTNPTDSLTLDFGIPRPLTTLKLYFLDDGDKITPPTQCQIDQWSNNAWQPLSTLKEIQGHRATTLTLPKTETPKLRLTLTHAGQNRTGLTEIEAWGPATLPLAPAPMPKDNLAHGAKITASFTSRFDKAEEAIDGKCNFNPEPRNRWTAYESPNASDTLDLDFGRVVTIARVELAIFSDGGGVQPPASYKIQTWSGTDWTDAPNAQSTPAKPAGGQYNQTTFTPTKTSKLRILFTHNGKSRSGVSEILAWPD